VRISRDWTASAYVKDATPPLVITPTSPLSPLQPSLILSSTNTITLLDRHFVPTRSWKAWDPKGRAIALVEAGGLLVGVGDDEKGFPVLKIWDLTRDEKKIKGGGPVLLRDVRIQHGSRRSMVRACCPLNAKAHTTGHLDRTNQQSVTLGDRSGRRDSAAIPPSSSEPHDESYGSDVSPEAARSPRIARAHHGIGLPRSRPIGNCRLESARER
jgi:hypothetical protein